jgi:hypothetical protein
MNDDRDQDLERLLRRALRPVSPDEDFSARVLARLTVSGVDHRGRPRSTHRLWLPAALAASLLCAFGAAQWHQRQRSLELHAQLVQALGITGDCLGDARAAVQDQVSSAL